MSRLTRDGTAEPVSQDQILRHERGQGNVNFPCSADHVQDWQPHPVNPYSAICVTIHRYIVDTISTVHPLGSNGENLILYLPINIFRVGNQYAEYEN